MWRREQLQFFGVRRERDRETREEGGVRVRNGEGARGRQLYIGSPRQAGRQARRRRTWTGSSRRGVRGRQGREQRKGSAERGFASITPFRSVASWSRGAAPAAASACAVNRDADRRRVASRGARLDAKPLLS